MINLVIKVEYKHGGAVRLILKMLCITMFWLGIGLVCAEDADDTDYPKQLPVIGEVKLRPGMRIEPPSRSVYQLSTSAIVPYLENFVVFSREVDYTGLPYVLGIMGENNYAAVGDRIYSLGIRSSDNLSAYTVLSDTGRYLENPETKERLGFNVHVIGNAEIQQYGTPQVLLITKSFEYIPVGCRLTPRVGLDLPDILDVIIPDRYMAGYILFTRNETTGVGKFGVVIISIGQRDGLKRGDLLTLVEQQTEIVDQFTDKKYKSVPTVFGEVVIYKVMEKVSLGFILETSRPVRVNDKAIVLVKESGGFVPAHTNTSKACRTCVCK